MTHFKHISPLPAAEYSRLNVDGQEEMVPAVFEDEDGIRFLIAPGPQIDPTTLDEARAMGISVTVWPGVDGWAHLIEGHTGVHDRLLTYRSLLGVLEAQEAAQRALRGSGSFVNVHTHTEFSALDGLSKVDEVVDLAKAMNQPALAITDHGVCAAHPHLQNKAVEAGIKPIFGLEAYFVNNRLIRPEAGDKESQESLKNDYWHLVLWAMDDEGLRNLWAMSTAAHLEGFYYRARLDWEVLQRLNKGVMASTACLRGPVTVPLLNDDEELARFNMARLQGIFGDRLYTEFHVNNLPDQIKANHKLIELANDFSVPLIAAVDSHYPCAGDKEAHQVWLAAQTNSDLQDETDLFAGGQDYHLMDRAEVTNRLQAHFDPSIVSAALDETVAMASRCNAQVRGNSDPPVYSKATPKMKRDLTDEQIETELLKRDTERLIDICLANWDRKVKGKPKPEAKYMERFEQEMKMYIDKKFCGYFDIVSDYTRWSKQEKHYIMGPSRGSGGACLVAYLADIIEIDPIDADLPLARFMTMGRMDPPDFDLDWPTACRADLQNYIAERWGETHVVRVGTHVRLRNKGVFRDLARIYKTTRPIEFKDIDDICKIIEAEEADSASLGKPWETVLLANEDLFAPYIARYPWLFEMVEKLVGRLKSYGRHAAGMVISTRMPLVDWLPMRQGEDGHMISDFDGPALESLGLLKFDFLTLRTLDTLQLCLNMVKDRRGKDISIYDWTTDFYKDPYIWEGMNDYTQGLFQIETSTVTGLMRQIKPQNLDELADVITLVRPGPRRSGLTDTYIRRKFGREEVTYPDPRLEQALSKTYGCIVYQEDIINVCQLLAGYSEEESNAVRKILGKKKVEAVAKAGVKFVDACVEHGMERDTAQALWDQMAEFAKYSFNRSHAYAYAVLAFWTGWFKFHYPSEFLAGILTTVDKDRIPDFVNEGHRMGFDILPPDINESGAKFHPYDTAIRYALLGIKGIGDKVVEAITENQPYKDFDDFMERKGKAVHSDHIALLTAVGAFDSLGVDRHTLEVKLAHEASPESDWCQHRDPTSNTPNGLPCGYDWSSEPVEFTPRGKPKKQRPLPKKCFKGCRRYLAPEPFNPVVEPYTDADIQDKEMEHLGVWLSSTPFDRINPQDLAACQTADQMNRATAGEYVVAAIIKRVTHRVDKNGNDYAFVTLFAQDGDIETPCWNHAYREFGSTLNPDVLVFCNVRKKINEDGREQFSLEGLMPA